LGAAVEQVDDGAEVLAELDDDAAAADLAVEGLEHRGP
jgi:hypothetical protein